MQTHAAVPAVTHSLQKSCATCNLKELCMPVGLANDELLELDDLISSRTRINKGEALFFAGDPFKSLFAIRTGTFKTRISSEEGADQVTGFQMTGEILGLDGISNNIHMCDAIALEDSEVCNIPYERLDELANKFRGLQAHFHRIMSREIVKDQNIMLLLGSMRAEQRLAAFFSNLSERQKARGFSAHQMYLRMSREEIGSFLGLKIETVSRMLKKLQTEQLIEINQRQLTLLDTEGLKRLATAR